MILAFICLILWEISGLITKISLCLIIFEWRSSLKSDIFASNLHLTIRRIFLWFVFEQNQNTSTEKADIEKQTSESEDIVSYLQNNIFSKFHPKGDSNKVLVLLEVFNSDYKSDLEHYPPIVSYLDLQTNKKVACSAKLFYTWNVLIK